MTRPQWLGRAEILIFFMCVTGMAMTGYYIFHPRVETKSVASEKASLGYVKPLGADVRVKAESEQNWNSVRRDANVFRNDRVYTGDSSAAKVNLKAGQTITVEPSSLIVIDDRGEKSLIDLGMGSFLGELKKGARLLVRVKGQDTEIKSDGATMRLQANEDKSLRVIVLSGSARVKNSSGQESKILTANDEATVQAEKIEVKSFPISLESPRPGATLWDDGQRTEFSWSNPNGPAKARLQIATDPEFKSIRHNVETEAERAEFKLQPGKVYFWRVRATGTAASRSPTSSFSYSALVPPKIAKEATVEVETDADGLFKNPVQFAWYDSMASESYEIQVARDASFARIEKTEQTERTEASLGSLAPGTYYWRVVSKAQARPDLTSELGKVSFVPKSEVLPLVDAVPAERQPALEDTNVESSPQQAVEEKIVSAESPAPSPIEPMKSEPQLQSAPKKADPAPVKKGAVTAVTKQPVAKAEPQKAAPEENPPAIKPKADAESKSDEPPGAELEQSNSRWSIGAFYGFKHLSLQQENTLGSAKVSVLLPNYFGLTSRFSYNDWEAWFLFDSYKLKYEAANASGEKQLSSLHLGGAWRMFWAGIRVEELPLFKNNGGSVDMTKQAFVFASVGTKHDWSLTTHTPTHLRLLTRLSYPLSLSTDNMAIEASSPGGFGLGGTVELRRQIYSTGNRQLYLVWPVSVDYQSLSQTINWAPSQGAVDSQLISISTSLGIQFDF